MLGTVAGERVHMHITVQGVYECELIKDRKFFIG